MQKYLLGLILLSFSFQGFTCEKLKGRYIQNKKTIEFVETFCLDEGRANSQNCKLLLMKKCPFSQIQKDLSVKDFLGPIGNPGFGLCHKLGGSPQIYELEFSKDQWKPYARCLSQDKKEFVDIETLVQHYP